MAIIYPSVYDKNIIRAHSEAEYKIIKQIESLDPIKTKDWVIFYSYCFKKRLDKYGNGLQGNNNNEIDFLILAPEVGIFVFEIKGGKIKYIPGRGFVSINKYNKEFDIDPFKQGRQNYYCLNNVLGKMSSEEFSNVEIKNYLSSNLVGFPDIDVVPKGDYQSNGHDIYVGDMDLYKFITKASEYLQQVSKQKLPPKSLIDLIVKKMNGSNFEYTKDKKIYIDSVNLSLKDLTEEQETVFKGLIDNKRCLVKGKAGTGKTVLCEFLFKHFSEEKKYSVLYLTFNKMIAEKINKDLPTNNYCKCYPILDYLEEEYKRITKDDNLTFQSFQEKKEFLFEAYAELLDNNNFEKFDCLIIDEAQDIDLTPASIKIFDNILNKGLNNGLCYIFYDFNQKIFNHKEKKIYSSELFDDEHYRYAKFELIRNCRNGQGVRNTITTLTETKLKSNNLNDISTNLINEDVKYFNITNSLSGANEIEKVIDELLDKGVDKQQITLLFNTKCDNGKNIIFNALNNKYKLIEFKTSKRTEISFATVSSFKGLENDVIIYVNDLKFSDLSTHYVAISRAKVFAYIYKVIEQ